MILAQKKSELRKIIKEKKGKQKIAFVPTLGHLHDGHLSLIRRAREISDLLIVSIFVNPIQFSPEEDFNHYPRDLERDLKILKKEEVDLVFAPDVDEIYHNDHSSYVIEKKLSKGLCGRSRPGHFRGVATIVTKLFNLVDPDLTVFGAKDYQQAKIIERIIRDLNFDIEIIICPIVREEDGLAMSSRNKYLSSKERKKAPVLYKSLKQAENLIRQGEKDPQKIRRKMIAMIEEAGGEIDYVEIVSPENLEPLNKIKDKSLIAVAVKIGNTRLIDNITIDTRVLLTSR